MKPLHEMADSEARSSSFMEKVEAKRRKPPVQLVDDACSGISIYLLKQDGTLWTIRRVYKVLEDGRRHEVFEPYKQVRSFGKTVACDVVLCLHCKAQSTDIEKLKHKQGNT